MCHMLLVFGLSGHKALGTEAVQDIVDILPRDKMRQLNVVCTFPQVVHTLYPGVRPPVCLARRKADAGFCAQQLASTTSSVAARGHNCPAFAWLVRVGQQ